MRFVATRANCRLGSSNHASTEIGSSARSVYPACSSILLPPRAAYLRWLIENPDRLHWPERAPGVRVRFGATTQALREALVDGPRPNRADVQARALAELERHGPHGSHRKWWAFEGYTEVDCWLETEHLLLFVEGKRTEPLAPSTHWYPERNQLVRNLEVVGELAPGRATAVMLVSEQAVADLTEETLRASTPHLDTTAREQLQRRYLGQTTWTALCEQLHVDFASLPDTLADALATDDVDP